MATLDLIGVPLDFGASRRGVDMGPSAVRAARLRRELMALGHDVHDSGNIYVPDRGTFPPGAQGHDFLPVITRICGELADHVERVVTAGQLPVVLGGDHSLSAGSVAGAARALRARGQRLGLLWVDAHSDINTPDSSPSGNVHGMPVAHLLGRGDPAMAALAGGYPAVLPQHVALVGLRDVDHPEREHLRSWGVHAYTMHDIDRRGLTAVLDEALDRVSSGTDGLWASYDLDAQDPLHAPGVGTPVDGGLSWREGHLIMELVAESGRLIGLDAVEVNPILDISNRTGELAAGLIASALGKRTL